MSAIKKSPTITRFLNLKEKSETPKPTIPPLKSKKNKIGTSQDGTITIELSTGEKYNGKIDDDMQVNGSGHLVFKDTEIGLLDYQGSFTKNRPDGFGELNLDDAKINYKGDFNNSKVEGMGRLTSNDVIYYGQWISNKFNGYGRIMKRNFALYEGLFIKDNRDGYGVEIYQNSDIYIGEFKKDNKSGIGIYMFFNGGFYYGFFKDNMRDGFGTLYDDKYRLLYIGYWNADKKAGRGIEYYINESKYNGYFEDNMRNGVGFMEYNKNLLYMGEWRNNMKHGVGKLDVNSKSVTGKFYNDQIVDSCFVDVSVFADKINSCEIEESMEEHLKNNNYMIKDQFLRGLHDLYKIIKDSLVDFVLQLVEIGLLRLKVYVILKNLFSKSAFENILEDIKLFLKYEPNMYYLESLWETSIAEMFRDKTDYNWNIWIIQESSKDSIFRDSIMNNDRRISGKSVRNDKIFIFNIVKIEETFKMMITNRIVKGENNLHDFEGILTNRGFELKYYSKDTQQLIKNIEYTIYPYFVTMDNGDKNYLMSLRLVMYSGDFYFYNDKSNPLSLIIFLNIDADNNIYSVGLDSVGAYIIAGEYDSQKKTGKFIQKYYQNYKIEYDAYLMDHDKIQGNWSTTNINGHFILRKNTSFKFANEVTSLMEILIKETDKSKNNIDISKIKDLSILLDSSIISVLISGSQGGILVFDQPKNETEDVNLFEMYKKKNNSNVNQKPGKDKKTITDSNVSATKLKENELTRVLSTRQRNTVMRLTNNSNDSTINTDNNGSKIKQPQTKISKSNLNDDFQRKLSTALRQLKQIDPTTDGLWQSRLTLLSEDITWVGHKTLLGKEDIFIIINLVMFEDRIEGLYIDEQDVSFELAGSYSARTKEFEIVGLSNDKTKTIKFKGEFNNLQLIGTLVKRPYNGPQMSFNAKMFGYDAKCDINIINSDSHFDNLPSILKIADNYFYAIVMIDKDYIFLNGQKSKNNFYKIDIKTMSKRLKNCSLIEVVEKNEEMQAKLSELNEKRFVFSSNDINLVIRY